MARLRRVLLVLLALAWAMAGGCAPRCALWPRNSAPIAKIGLVAPFEGRYRAMGYEALHAVRLALYERNEQGGAAGTAVELVALNDDGDPERAAALAAQFAVDPDVYGVIGPFSLAAVSAAAPAYAEHGLPLITPATCPPEPSSVGAQGLYCLGVEAGALARAVVAPLPRGVEAVLLRRESDPFVEALAATGLVTVDLEASEVAPALAQAGRVDVAVYGGEALEAGELLLAMREGGVEAPLWGGPALARRQLPQVAGPAATGTCYAVTAAAHADLGPGSPFWTAYAARAGEGPGPWAGLAYDAAVALLDALQGAIEGDGVPTREGVRERLVVAVGPDGRALFAAGRRAGGEVAWYCYGEGTPYPGQRQGW